MVRSTSTVRVLYSYYVKEVSVSTLWVYLVGARAGGLDLSSSDLPSFLEERRRLETTKPSLLRTAK